MMCSGGGAGSRGRGCGVSEVEVVEEPRLEGSNRTALIKARSHVVTLNIDDNNHSRAHHFLISCPRGNMKESAIEIRKLSPFKS